MQAHTKILARLGTLGSLLVLAFVAHSGAAAAALPAPSVMLVAEEVDQSWAHQSSMAELWDAGVRGFGLRVSPAPPEQRCETVQTQACTTTPETVCTWVQSGCQTVCGWWCSWWGCTCDTVCGTEQLCETVATTVCEPVAATTCWWESSDSALESALAEAVTLAASVGPHAPPVTLVVEVLPGAEATWETAKSAAGVSQAGAALNVVLLPALQVASGDLADVATLALDACATVDAPSPLYVRATTAGGAFLGHELNALWRRVQRCSRDAGRWPTFIGVHGLAAEPGDATAPYQVLDALLAAAASPWSMPADASPAAQAAMEVMAVRHASHQGVAWDYTVGNALQAPQADRPWWIQSPEPGHWHSEGATTETPGLAPVCEPTTDDCHPDFGLQRCVTDADCTGGGRCQPLRATVTAPDQSPELLCLGHSDRILDAWYGAIVEAQFWVDLTTLTLPDGRFVAAIRNALTFLASAERAVTVRLLVAALPGLEGELQEALDSYLRDMPADHPLTVHVAAYREGIDSWNHAKIVAVDGQRLLQGGHNLWTADYLKDQPVHDLSMHVAGPVTWDAHRFVDAMWAHACPEFWGGYSLPGWKSAVVAPASMALCPAAFEEMAPAPTPTPAAGDQPQGTAVLSMARFGAIGEQPSDDAIQAMLDAAQHTLDLSLQDLGPVLVGPVAISGWPADTLAALARAVVRGVQVRLVLSQAGAVPGGQNPYLHNYGNGWSAQDVLDRVKAHFDRFPHDVPASFDLQQALCDNLHITTIQVSEDHAIWPTGQLVGNHAKFFAVDGEAFYLGSQNLYSANLAEFGLVVDDVAQTQDLLDAYFEPMWTASAAGAAACQ